MTRARLMRRVAYVFFAAYAVLVTFPGVLPFRGPRPFMFGMPLPMVWVSAWVIAGGIVLWLLDRAHAGGDREPDAATVPPPGMSSEPGPSRPGEEV